MLGFYCIYPLCIFVTKVEYKKDLENNRGYSMNYCDTPQFKNVSKISKFTSDVSFQYLMLSWQITGAHLYKIMKRSIAIYGREVAHLDK